MEGGMRRAAAKRDRGNDDGGRLGRKETQDHANTQNNFPPGLGSSHTHTVSPRPRPPLPAAANRGHTAHRESRTQIDHQPCLLHLHAVSLVVLLRLATGHRSSASRQHAAPTCCIHTHRRLHTPLAGSGRFL